MSMVSSGGVTVTIKSKELSKVFLQYHDIVDTFIREEYFPPNMSKVEITDDEVLLSISDVDRQFFCPKTLDALIECLVTLCTGDEEIMACLEEGDDPEELEEDFGEIVRFAAELYSRGGELISSIIFVRWEQNRTDEEEGETTTELFTYDQEHGVKYSTSGNDVENDGFEDDIDEYEEEFSIWYAISLNINCDSDQKKEVQDMIIEEFGKVGCKVIVGVPKYSEGVFNKDQFYIEESDFGFGMGGLKKTAVEEIDDSIYLKDFDPAVIGDVFKTIKKKFSNIKIRGALQFGEKSNESSAYFWYESAPGAEDVMVKNTIVDEDEIIVPVE